MDRALELLRTVMHDARLSSERRGGHVGVVLDPLAQPPMHHRGPVRERGSRSAGLHGGQKTAFEGEWEVPDRKDAAVHTQEVAGVNPPRDRAVAQPAPTKIVEVHDAPLARRRLCDASVHFSTQCVGNRSVENHARSIAQRPVTEQDATAPTLCRFSGAAERLVDAVEAVRRRLGVRLATLALLERAREDVHQPPERQQVAVGRRRQRLLDEVVARDVDRVDASLRRANAPRRRAAARHVSAQASNSAGSANRLRARVLSPSAASGSARKKLV